MSKLESLIKSMLDKFIIFVDITGANHLFVFSAKVGIKSFTRICIHSSCFFAFCCGDQSLLPFYKFIIFIIQWFKFSDWFIFKTYYMPNSQPILYVIYVTWAGWFAWYICTYKHEGARRLRASADISGKSWLYMLCNTMATSQHYGNNTFWQSGAVGGRGLKNKPGVFISKPV